jgi:alpha-ketoglutarate-dependent taurine dioxygenase
MPWIYEACWKLVKLVLHPELTKRILFVNEKTLEEFVDEKILLDKYGRLVI